MEEIAISKFKATCLSVLERVRKTKTRILVTRFGEPVAELVPVSQAEKSSSWLGSMQGTAEIVGDIVSPVGKEDDWEVLRD